MTPASGARPSARGASPHHREATYVAVIAILGVLLFSSLLQSTYDSRGGSNSSILRHIEIEHNQDQQAQDSPDHQHENPLRDQSDSGTADTEYEPAKRSSAELCSTEFPWIELVVKKVLSAAYNCLLAVAYAHGVADWGLNTEGLQHRCSCAWMPQLAVQHPN